MCVACNTRLFTTGNIVRLDFTPMDESCNELEGATLVNDEDDDEDAPAETGKRPIGLSKSIGSFSSLNGGVCVFFQSKFSTSLLASLAGG